MGREKLQDYYYQKAILNDKPVSVMIELLTQCNLKCQHCYLPEHNKKGFSTEKIKSLLYELHEVGIFNVSFTGGEIFLRKDLLEIIALTRELHMRVFLLSNGTLLNEENINYLSQLKIAEFSTTIFSMRKEIHDAITCCDGSLEMVIDNIMSLKKNKVRVKVKTPLLNINSPYYQEIKQFCDLNGFDFLTSPAILNRYDGNREPQKLRVSEEEFSKLIPQIDQTNIRGGVSDTPCAALLCSFAIDCEGNVTPCNSFMYPVGNVYQNSIEDIWYNSSNLKKIKKITKQDLHQCQDCRYKVNCHRCPAIAYMETGDFLGCDPYAKKVAQVCEKK